MNDFMNLDVLKEKIPSTAKLVWHLIKLGVNTPTWIAASLGLGRQTVNDAISTLTEYQLVFRLGYGQYGVKEGVRPTELSVRPAVQSVRPAVQLEGKSTVDRTVENEVYGSPYSSKRTAHRAVGTVDRTESTASPTDRPADRTLCAGTQISFKQIKEKKERKILSLKDFLSQADFETNPAHAEYREKIAKLLCEKKLSDDLVDRVAVAGIVSLPGFDAATVNDVLREASQLQRQEKIKHRYVHVARYVQDVFNANGIEWEPCRPHRVCQIQRKIAQNEEPAASPPPAVPKRLSREIMDEARKYERQNQQPAQPIRQPIAETLRQVPGLQRAVDVTPPQRVLKAAVAKYEEVEEIPQKPDPRCPGRHRSAASRPPAPAHADRSPGSAGSGSAAPAEPFPKLAKAFRESMRSERETEERKGKRQ